MEKLEEAQQGSLLCLKSLCFNTDTVFHPTFSVILFVVSSFTVPKSYLESWKTPFDEEDRRTATPLEQTLAHPLLVQISLEPFFLISSLGFHSPVTLLLSIRVSLKSAGDRLGFGFCKSG